MRSAQSVAVRLISALAVAVGVVATPAGAGPVPAPVCSWPFAQSGETPNVMAPHPETGYWFLRYSAIPGSGLVIRGSYAQSRYFSFVAHDESLTALQGINDTRIEPDPGSHNPFMARGNGPTNYTVRVDFDPPPAQHAANTLYAGHTLEGYPNPGGYLIYRVFLPHDREDPTGGVPLPEVILELPGGSTELSFSSCPPVPPTGAQRPINDSVEQASRPSPLAGFPPPTNRVRYPPKFEVIYNGQVLDAALSQILPEQVYDPLPHRPGTTYGNTDVKYVILLTHREHGEVIVFRAKAPSYLDMRAGELATARKQVRLWNACTAGSPQDGGFFGLDCIDDEEATLTLVSPRRAVTPHAWDTRGEATFVVSDPEHKPARNMAEANWLPSGPFAETMIFYRFMLPHPRFAEHPGNVPEGTDPAEVMGEYFPEAAYCSTETFDQGGADACFAEQEAR